MAVKQIDPVLKEAIDGFIKAYSESEAKTKAGRLLRFIVRFVPLSTIVDALVHKNK